MDERVDPAAAGGVRIGLLGPVTAWHDDAEVELGSRMQRGTLALLALQAGQAVPAARVIAGLWGQTPPPTATGTLRAYLSRLRGLIGGDLLQRDAGGYRLALPPEHVDATTFQRLLDAGRAAIAEDPRTAVDLLERARACWRGDALADVADLPFAAEAIGRLHELRRHAQVLAWRLQLAGGTPGGLLEGLQAATTRDPGDEDLVGLLMVALYRSGRQGEALQRYVALAEHQSEALGVDPGPQVRRLHQLILAQDPELMAGDPLAPPAGRTPGLPAASAGHDGLGGTDAAPAASPGSRALAAGSDGAPAPAPMTTPSNLPVQLSSFVGRTAQLEILARMTATSRLVTLTGAGGVGKTRLALEATRRAGAHDADGPWVVELAGVAEASLVVNSVCQALGVQTAGTVPEDALVSALRGRPALILLDNCEHVIDAAAALVVQLLGACRDLRIIATSREPLGVPGEHVLVIPSLPPADAEQLFADRAGQVAPGFAAEGPVADQVRQVCRALDGIPLAIELAAARLSALSMDHITALMEDRFALLQGTRAVVARHRTLAAAIGWSYDPLPPDERDVLHAACAFAGGFTLEALAVVADRDLPSVAAALSALVDKSMATVIDEGRTRRYRILETIRDYCTEQAGPAVMAALADRHVDWVGQVTARVASGYLGEDPPWIEAIAERDNIRAALSHCDASGDIRRMLRICSDLSWLWFRQGQVAEGNRWMDRVVAHLDAAGDAGVPAGDLAQMYMGRSLCAYLGGDLETAQRAILRGVEASQRTDDPVLAALAPTYLGYFHAAFGQLDQVDPLLDAAEAHDIPEWALAEIDMVRGQLRRAQGRTAEAVEVLQRSRERADRHDHVYMWGSSGWILSKLLLDVGRAEEAGAVLAETLQRLARQGDRSSTLACLHTMAAIAGPLGRLYEGAVLLGAVDALGDAIGYHPLKMDPVDGPRQRALVATALPEPVLDRAMAEGAGYSIGQAVGLAVRVGSVPARG